MKFPAAVALLFSVTQGHSTENSILPSTSHGNREILRNKILELKNDFRSKVREVSDKRLSLLNKREVSSKSLQFDEESSSNLRGLKMKDNFWTYSAFTDEACATDPYSLSGYLVNYCFNEQDSSYLFKINKKENFLVEISYKGLNCQGIPDKVTQILGTEIDSCTALTNDDDDDDADDDVYETNAIIVGYTSTYPDLMSTSAMYLVESYTPEMCNPNHVNYHSFSGFPLAWVFYPGCYTWDQGSYRFDLSTCSQEHQAYVRVYTTPDCTGPAESEPLFNPPCTEQDDDDDTSDMDESVVEYCT